MARRPQHVINLRLLSISLMVIVILNSPVFAKQEFPMFQTNQVTKGKISQSLQSFGTIDSKTKVAIRSKTLGTLNLIVKEGQVVKKGQLLASIKNPKLKDAIINSQNQYLLSQLDMEGASRKLNQGQKLFAIKAISKEAFLDLESAYKRSKINLENAIKSLEYAKEELEYTTITAPFDGKITAITAMSQSDVVAGSEILNLANMQNLMVNMTIPQVYLQKIKPGQAVIFEAGMLSEPVPGSLVGISQKVDKPDGDKQGVTVSCRFFPKNPNNILVGAMVVGHIVVAKKTDIPMLPINTVWGSPSEGFYVFTQEGKGKITKRPVQIGISDQKNVEIVSDTKDLKNVVVVLDSTTFAALSARLSPDTQ